MAKAGRPTKLTPQLQEELCRVVATGNYLETSCAYVGVSTASVRDWMRRGARAKRGIYAEFLAAIKKAMAQAEARDVATIVQASRENWQAAAWRLERKHWKRWGRKDKLQQQVEQTAPQRIEIEYVNNWRASYEADSPATASGPDSGDAKGEAL